MQNPEAELSFVMIIWHLKAGNVNVEITGNLFSRDIGLKKNSYLIKLKKNSYLIKIKNKQFFIL